jgi:hypothetical protein
LTGFPFAVTFVASFNAVAFVIFFEKNAMIGMPTP